MISALRFTVAHRLALRAQNDKNQLVLFQSLPFNTGANIEKKLKLVVVLK